MNTANLRRYSLSSDEGESRDGSKGPLALLSGSNGNLRESFSSAHPHTIWTARNDYAYDTRLLFKRRITNLYIQFTNLKSYVEINYSGFRKIIKKYDKVTYSEVRPGPELGKHLLNPSSSKIGTFMKWSSNHIRSHNRPRIS